MKRKIDPQEIRWFGPVWRRIALIAVIAAWSALELYNGNGFWGYMTLAVFAYLVWRLFIAFPSAAEIAAYKAEQDKSGPPK